LIDPVATGIANAPSEIKNNTNVVWLGRRDGNYEALDRLIFKKATIKLQDPKLTKLTTEEYEISHSQSGRIEVLRNDLREAAEAAGVKFKTP
jgi:hypothetical protein